MTEHGGDVMVSVGPSRKFTPVRHDGTLEEEKENDRRASPRSPTGAVNTCPSLARIMM